MAVNSIGMDFTGMTSGFSEGSHGFGVYRKNRLGNAPETQQTGYASKDGRSNGDVLSVKAREDADQKRRFDSFECETCENRRYQDGSDDSGVSFQTPTKIDPKNAAAAVRGHEQEHVVRNRAKAEREGNEIVSQSVTLHTGICPECGKTYISGGTTRTAIRIGGDDSEKFTVGMYDPEKGKGNLLDTAV